MYKQPKLEIYDKDFEADRQHAVGSEENFFYSNDGIEIHYNTANLHKRCKPLQLICI